MPAVLVEDPDDLPANAESSLEAAQVSGSPTAPAVAATDLSGEEVPEKYRGKSARELLDIVQNQESLMGRHSQEVGELREQNGTLRGLVDSSLALRDPGNAGRVADEESELSDDDFTLNPKDATAQTVRSETQSLRDDVTALKSVARGAEFSADFPDALSDLNDQKFVDFVSGSGTRQGLASRAFSDPQNVDYDSARQLWELYTDYKSMSAPVITDADADTTTTDAIVASPADSGQQAPDLITGSSGGGSGVAASGKPLYSQAALNAMQDSNPDLYWRDDTQAKIAEARAEGRVKQDV